MAGNQLPVQFQRHSKEDEINGQWEEITLEDGRTVWRDANGRLRDARGRWVKRSLTAPVPAGRTRNEPVKEEETISLAAQQAARQHMLQAVRQLGYAAEDPADAWGKLVGVQVGIAMDGQGGTKSTSAVKFVADATGLMELEEEAQQLDGLQLNIGPEAAQRLLDILVLIRAELDQGG